MGTDRLTAPFQRKALVWLVALVTSSVGMGLALLIVGPEREEVSSSGADSYSRSAIGHRAFVDLLRARGIPVLVSRYNSGRLVASALLIVAEPQIESAASDRGHRLGIMMGSADTVLLVLPKWRGEENPSTPGWLLNARLVPESLVAASLSTAAIAATLSRQTRSGRERCNGAPEEITWQHPQLLHPTSNSLAPVLSCEGGVLLGEIDVAPKPRIFVLSDPDILANHGLGAGQNAQLLLWIMDRIRRPGQAVVLDETVHGHERIPSLWRDMFALPILPSVVQAVLALAALILSAVGRFGAPIPAAAGVQPGKTVLIENTAHLLREAGYSEHTLQRYLDMVVNEVFQALHGPELRPEARRAWLARVSFAKGVKPDVESLQAQVDRLQESKHGDAAVVAAARRVHRWRREMLRWTPKS